MTIAEFARKKQQEGALREGTELILDGLILKTISEEDSRFLSENFSATLRLLSMNRCFLQNLDRFPVLPNLEQLELHDNKLVGPEVLAAIGRCCPKLEGLHMAANRFDDITPFLALANQLPRLAELDLEMNPLFEKASSRYNTDELRQTLFQTFPYLKVLNALDQQGNEVDDDDDDGDEYGDEDGDADGDGHGDGDGNGDGDGDGNGDGASPQHGETQLATSEQRKGQPAANQIINDENAMC